MASTQNGTGSLTVAGQATQAALHITVPEGAVVESVTFNGGGSPDYEDVQDGDGAFHTRITFEKGMHTATVTLFGAPYTTDAGNVDGSGSNYYIESNQKELSKGPVRSVITVTRLPTIA